MSNIKKIYITFLCAAFIVFGILCFSERAAYAEDPDFGSWAAYAAEGFAEGSGIKTDPFLIKTEAQLAYLAVKTNGLNGQTADNFSDKFIQLENDLNLSFSNLLWVPIGTFENKFLGTFDGGGHNITGLKIIASEHEYQGLFGYNSGTIKNVNIKKCSINAKSNLGAVVGYNAGTIQSCTASGFVFSSAASNELNHAGGIAGFTEGSKILDCENSCEISCAGSGGFESRSGGIAGGAIDGAEIKDCTNNGEITASKSMKGGIVGYTSGTTISNCLNYGKIMAYRNAGGIAGYASNNVEFDYCANLGDVTALSEYAGYAGGIAGNCSANVKIINCLNSGNINAQNYSGGIAGYQNTTLISCSFNSGNIVATAEYAGGITGCIDSGIVPGYEGVGYINNCYNSGSVSANTHSGGIAGENLSKIKNCYNIGNIQGSMNTGAVIGINSGGGNSSNCYYDKDKSGISGAVNGQDNNTSNMKFLNTEDMVRDQMKNLFSYESGVSSDYWFFSDSAVSDPDDNDYFCYSYPQIKNLAHYSTIFAKASSESALSHKSFKKPPQPYFNLIHPLAGFELAYGSSPFKLIFEGHFGYTLTFTVQQGNVSISSDGTVTALGAGDVIILATCPSDDSYSATTVAISFKVNKVSAAYSVNFDGVDTKDIKTKEPSVNVPGDYKGKITYYYKPAGADDSAYAEIKPSKAGKYTVKAVFAGDDNYLGGIAYADFTIKSGGLDDWLIPVIIIGGVLLLGAAAFSLYWFKFKKKRQPK